MSATLTLDMLVRARAVLSERGCFPTDPPKWIVNVGPQSAPKLVEAGVLPTDYEVGRTYGCGDYEVAVHPIIPGTQFVVSPTKPGWMQ